MDNSFPLFVVGLLFGAMLTAGYVIMVDGFKLGACARDNNVYRCEIIETVVPIRHPTTGGEE